MRDLAVLFLHLVATLIRLVGPGGARAVVAESVLIKQQLLILNRSRRRSPNLRLADRVVAGVCTLLMRPSRLVRVAIVLKPSTLLRLHRALTTRKYRRLFSSTVPKRPGPKGPSREVIAAVVDMKQRNPTWGCPRIAHQIALAFGIPMNKDVVRRILAVRYTPKPDAAGPSWLTALGHAKDSLWSVDLFRCESAILRVHWVLVVMDQCTRRIVGFGVHRGAVDGAGLCRMFNRATRGHTSPKYLSSDHDRLYQCPPMAGQLAHPRRGRNQDGAVRAALASLRGATHWHDSTGMSGPHALLDGGRSGDEAPRVPALLQRSSRPCGAGRASAGNDPGGERRPRKSRFVSLAAALSWSLSHADGGVRCVRGACGRCVRSGDVSPD